MGKQFAYDIHGIITIQSECILPEIEPFRVQTEIPEPTIRVGIGVPRRFDPARDEGRYLRYSEMFGSLGFEVGIELNNPVEVMASPGLRYSPHVLYTNVVEPLLRWTFVKKGYALVHGATIAFGQKAYVITARTDTGKTTTLLKILSYQRRNSDQAAFLSDDMTIVSSSGQALTYPKPLTISFHTLRAVKAETLKFSEKITLPIQSRIHSREGRQVAFWIRNSHLPAATINMLAQMFVPPPKYFVQKLIPKVKLAKNGNLSGMFIIERGDGGIQPMENNEAVDVLLENCEDAYGFPPYEHLKEFLYLHNGTDLRAMEHTIIRSALQNLPATVIRSTNLNWWSQIPLFVGEKEVARDISRAMDLETRPRTGERRAAEKVEKVDNR
ncbi:MAG TPA: hypothetical protein VGK00_02835 [Anaerolineales bacterium]|jgi:hypothetical protein